MLSELISVELSIYYSIILSKLLAKLKALGIEGKLLAWLSAFSHNRRESVV
jgi:hypothetical protein